MCVCTKAEREPPATQRGVGYWAGRGSGWSSNGKVNFWVGDDEASFTLTSGANSSHSIGNGPLLSVFDKINHHPKLLKTRANSATEKAQMIP